MLRLDGQGYASPRLRPIDARDCLRGESGESGDGTAGSRQVAAGSECETAGQRAVGRWQRAENAKRQAQSAGRTEEQRAGGSRQLAGSSGRRRAAGSGRETSDTERRRHRVAERYRVPAVQLAAGSQHETAEAKRRGGERETGQADRTLPSVARPIPSLRRVAAA
jgi:hypothetical protein